MPAHTGLGTAFMEQTAAPTGVPTQYRLRVIRHTGLLLAWLQSTRQYTGTYEQCMTEHRKAQQHNLLFGWWSIGSILFLNWFALISNSRAAKQLGKIAGKT
jgi:hypothetical protein